MSLQGLDDALPVQAKRGPSAAQVAFVLTGSGKLEGAGAAANSERGHRLGVGQRGPKRALLRRRRHVGRETGWQHGADLGEAERGNDPEMVAQRR